MISSHVEAQTQDSISIPLQNHEAFHISWLKWLFKKKKKKVIVRNNILFLTLNLSDFFP